MKPVHILRLLIVFVLVAAACGDDDTSVSTTQAPAAPPDAAPSMDAVMAELRSKLEGQKVTIGTSSSGNASSIGAWRMADFLREDFGVDVDFRALDSDPLVAATIAGSIEVGQLSLAGMASAVSAGSDFVAFGGDDQKNPFLLLAKAPMTSAADLAGELIAITQSLDQITGQTARKCLQEVGLDIESDVELLRLGGTRDTTAAIASGQVAGGISAMHRITPLILEEGPDAYNILCLGSEVNPQISSVWYANRQWIAENPDMALAINIAALKSARWMQEDKQRWIDYTVANVDATPETAFIDYDNFVGVLDNWPVNGSLDRELLEQTIATSFEFGVLDELVPVDDLVTFEFQDRALEILGPATRNVDTGGAAPPDAAPSMDAVMAELRSKLEGQKVTIGTSSSGNASSIGAWRMADFLREDFGVDVDFRALDSDPLVAATIAGSIEVGQLSLAGMASAVSAGSDFVAFGGDDQKNPFLLLAKAPMTSAADLAGELIAITQSLDQITGQTARKCLQEVGLDIESDVELLRLGGTRDTTAAIASGQVAGGISAMHRITPLILEEGPDAYNILCLGSEVNPQISSVWYANRQWIAENPDMALAINIAALKSARWMQEDKQRWIDYTVANVDATPETAFIDYDNFVGVLDNWPVNGSLDRELLEQTIATSFEFGVLDELVPVDDLVTFEFQDRALEILGPATRNVDTG
jgi:sulfonate transport system substrate-binding protein